MEAGLGWPVFAGPNLHTPHSTMLCSSYIIYKIISNHQRLKSRRKKKQNISLLPYTCFIYSSFLNNFSTTVYNTREYRMKLRPGFAKQIKNKTDMDFQDKTIQDLISDSLNSVRSNSVVSINLKSSFKPRRIQLEVDGAPKGISYGESDVRFFF